MALQHLRSSTANKRPTPGAMSDGQLALNTNLVSPGLFFKDSNGDSVKIGPVHVGTTAPNVTPGAGGQAGNSKGEQWLDTTGGVYVFKIYDGTAWRSETGTFVDVNGDTMTGALGIIAGSAASPGLFFSGDANSGLYSPGADQVAVATNGTGRLFIDSSGNVGIGTASPNDYANYSTLTLNDTTGSIIDFEANGTICGELQALANEFRINAVGASGVLKMYAGATERLRITSAGLVGVGTSSPSSLLHLVSSGQPTITVADDGGRTLQVKAPDGSANPGFVGTTTNHNLLLQAGTTAGGLNVMRFNTAGAERVRITDTGRVGIGTSAPDLALSVNGAVNLRNSTRAGAFEITSGGDLWMGTATSLGSIYFETGHSTTGLPSTGTARVTINSTGLGIGTSSPSTLLHLSGLNSGGGSANTIRVTDTDTAVITDQICGRIEFETADTGNPGVNCQIDALYSGSGGGSKLQFRTGFAGALVDALHISDTGLVGIGTASPDFSLDVNGTVGITEGGPISWHDGSGTLAARIYGTATDEIRFERGSGASRSLTIDSSGRLLVGTSTARTIFENGTASARVQVEGTDNSTSRLTVIRNGGGGGITLAGTAGASVGSIDAVANNATLGEIAFAGSDGTDFVNAANISAHVDGTPGANDMPGRLVFSTTADGAATPTERMRILSNGHMLLNTTSDLAHLTVVDSTYGASDIFIRTFGLSSNSFVVRGDGDCENTNNAYGAFSDIKLKENIVVASSQWNDIKALQVRNYNLKSNPSFAQIGLVAQEVETVSPGLVSELPDRDEDGNDLGTVTKSVKYSVLYMKAVKALQEAMERIEQLEADVAQLKGA
jgi:hypothetical protein